MFYSQRISSGSEATRRQAFVRQSGIELKRPKKTSVSPEFRADGFHLGHSDFSTAWQTGRKIFVPDAGRHCPIDSSLHIEVRKALHSR
jgi:hypothetical protein